MNYNVDYEICTIIFLMLLLIISRVRKRLVDFQSKMYQIFMDVCFMNICLDVITCYTDSYYKAVPIWLNYGLNIIFLMVQCMIPMMVMLYIYMKVQQIREGKRCFLILAAFPAVTVERLQSGDCGIEGGIALVDLVTSFERISSHCANISLHIVKRVGNDRNFDEMHGHANDSFSEEYKALYHYYESQYIAPVLEESALTDPAAEASKTDTDKTEKKSASKTNKPDNKKKAPKSEPSKKDGKNRPKKLSEKHKK